MKIYTKTGDKGTTQLVSGERVQKHHCRIQAYGDVDELNSCIGMVISHIETNHLQDLKENLINIQHHLFNIGSVLASSKEDVSIKLPQILDQDISDVEKLIDQLTIPLPPLKSFILPGGHIIAAHLHHCRTVARRAERNINKIIYDNLTVPQNILVYMNRLSDLFFVQSRYVNFKTGYKDILWSK